MGLGVGRWNPRPKDRSLMNLAMLTALNRAPEIKLHVKGALNNGVTVRNGRRCMRQLLRIPPGSMHSAQHMKY
jgi:hypothetical protein